MSAPPMDVLVDGVRLGLVRSLAMRQREGEARCLRIVQALPRDDEQRRTFAFFEPKLGEAHEMRIVAPDGAGNALSFPMTGRVTMIAAKKRKLVVELTEVRGFEHDAAFDAIAKKHIADGDAAPGDTLAVFQAPGTNKAAFEIRIGDTRANANDPQSVHMASIAVLRRRGYTMAEAERFLASGTAKPTGSQ